MSDYDKIGRFQCAWSLGGQGNGCPSWTKDNSDTPEFEISSEAESSLESRPRLDKSKLEIELMLLSTTVEMLSIWLPNSSRLTSASIIRRGSSDSVACK